MQQIIAIGGGGFTKPRNGYKMERYLLQQTNLSNPRVCFLPQASVEDKDYITKFYEAFLSLGARPSWISLFGRVENTWKDHLLQQDLIYVGGGNTRSMLALWREWKLDEVLFEAYQNSTVLAGVSAGAICWFEQCITDSVWPLGALAGLGLLKGSCCPHYDSEPERRPAFLSMIKNKEVSPGIALEDDTAAHYVDGQLHRIIACDQTKKGYRVTEQGEQHLEMVYL